MCAPPNKHLWRPDYLPVDERHPVRPVDVNGINKMAGECYHVLYSNVYGIRACALRLTNTYGGRTICPWMKGTPSAPSMLMALTKWRENVIMSFTLTSMAFAHVRSA